MSFCVCVCVYMTDIWFSLRKESPLVVFIVSGSMEDLVLITG